MSFSAAWLALREPADRRARNPDLRAAAGAFLAAVPAPLVLDLGCGTGATRRALAADAPGDARWRLVDHDAGLLAEAAREGGEPVSADLADVPALPFDGVRLVTASALLDLASAAWIEAVAARAAGAGAGVYATLSYDGQFHWEPSRSEDAEVIAAFNRHQRRDKGLGGPALGPEAPAALAAALAARGYAVRTAPSAWVLRAPADAPLLAALAEGVAAAAAEEGAAEAGAWGQARRAARAGVSATVGHVDLLAVPPSTQSKTTSDSSA